MDRTWRQHAARGVVWCAGGFLLAWTLTRRGPRRPAGNVVWGLREMAISAVMRW